MTQPTTAAPTTPPQQSHTGAIIAVAAVGLALVAVEARVRHQVEDDITTALAAFTVLLLAVLATPGVVIATGVQLMADPTVHAGLVKTITATKASVTASIETGYAAAAQVAHTKATADLAHDDYQVPTDLPPVDPSIDQIVQDLDAMFGHAQTDITNTVIAGFDGVQGSDADPARRLVAGKAVEQATARLQQRAAAAAGTAVNQGASDTQQGIYTQYQNSTGRVLGKRWVTTSATPCGMCEELNGSIVVVSAEFDHQATTNDKDLRPVWRTLYGPPRHPNCRCQLELVVLPA